VEVEAQDLLDRKETKEHEGLLEQQVKEHPQVQPVRRDSMVHQEVLEVLGLLVGQDLLDPQEQVCWEQESW
jgi:hypothetical protein